MRTLLTAVGLSVAMSAGALAQDNELTKQEKADGWILLFNGKDMDDWMTNRKTPSNTAAENGAFNTRKCGGYLLVHKDQFSDYVLSFDYKPAPGANSGVFLRQFPLKPPKGLLIYECGIEVQILDALETPVHDTGAIYDLVPTAVDARKPAGEWNHMEITVDGPNISVMVNGQATASTNLDEYTEILKRPDGTPHKFNVAFKDHPRQGYIGFQDHGDECWFKNVRIKPLNGSGPVRE